MVQDNDKTTFWEHLDVLRLSIIRSIIVTSVLSVIIFCFKDFLFEGIVFAPTKEEFCTFRFLNYFSEKFSVEDTLLEIQPVKIINTKLSAQLFIHLSISFYFALIISIPYILGEIWFFLKPALYEHEKKLTIKALCFMTLLFYLGVLTSYFLIFPLSVNFLAAYQVSPEIENLVDLDSYIDTLTSLTLSLGLVFELPVLAHFLSKIGILSYNFMKNHRKHAFIAVLFLAAIITPSTDIFTMLLTALPLQLIYELSVSMVKRNEKLSLKKNITNYANYY